MLISSRRLTKQIGCRRLLGWAVMLGYGLAGCNSLVQDVNPGLLPNATPQLVIHSYLSPQDTVLTAAVSLSRTSTGNQSSTTEINSLPNATVTLSEGPRSVALRYDARQSLYRADPAQFPIQAGHTYTLAVSTPDGLTARANTTVPVLVPITSFRSDSATARFEQAIDYFVQFSWQDPANVVNYYHLAGDNEYGSTERVLQGNTFVDHPFRAVGSIYYGVTYGQNFALTDQDRDGQVFDSPQGRLSYSNINGQRINTPPLTANVYLLSVDVAYYQYHQSLYRQQDTNSNPFAEPTLITGNIQGGFGCFGSYCRSSVSARIK
ncbi:DUF4249 domain-containing protein [Spirosoma utsteinense]|uniref:DUF4249 domain-containing protein n=1 Tax=Spirosoma utsteinense TaxID=2585773 RepID=A0ABR6WEM8_9BACT|nr:DUF4249 domain-containing protein [Spirosoma utsteinense]MBC3788929.1 hypothetical protein [Spirosoma utsteinense]MBC3794653.1 hypothetical protein [Spirosoma utsteinense]